MYSTRCQVSKDLSIVYSGIHNPVVSRLQSVLDGAAHIRCSVFEVDAFILLRSVCLQTLKSVLSRLEGLDHLFDSCLQLPFSSQHHTFGSMISLKGADVHHAGRHSTDLSWLLQHLLLITPMRKFGTADAFSHQLLLCAQHD